MKILVLYTLHHNELRKTILDHLYSFQTYIKDAEIHYCNALFKIPSYLTFVQYDGVILHYTLLSYKWDPLLWNKLLRGLKNLKKMKAVKVAIPQDEYIYTEKMSSLFKLYSIETIFTCASEDDYQKLYPREKSGLKHYFTVLPGYVDESSLDTISKLAKKNSKRDVDIGYRARDLPFWLGAFSQIKKEIEKVFLDVQNQSSLKMDISTDPEKVFYGDDWYRFILRCRTMLGCLSGASLHDPHGHIREKVDSYVHKHPLATFEEVEEHCFKDKDYSLSLFTLSPRHFECAMAKVCQVLVEGDYLGIFLPGIHYIEIKKDYSNLSEVLKKIEDQKQCEEIAQKAYEDIVASGKYTYSKFAHAVIGHIHAIAERKRTSTVWNNLVFKIIGYCLDIRKKLNAFVLLRFRANMFLTFRVPNKIRKEWKKLRNR